MRVGTIADKMQKWIPKDGGSPNYERYRQLADLLIKEVQNAKNEFDKYKAGLKGNGANGNIFLNNLIRGLIKIAK